MAKKGITGATYRRKDGTIVNYSIEAAVRRDILTATCKLINTSSLKEVELIGAEYVEVSSHIGARVSKDDPIADHAGWQGKVYKLEGADEQYDNFYEKTGYGDILGLGGVNCRHHFFAFFPGISTPISQKIDLEENERIYKLTQQQRRMEREIRALKKEKMLYERINDDEAYDDEGLYSYTLVERLNNLVSNDFGHVTYTEAIEILEKSGKSFEYPVKWGIDLQTEHERYITEEVFGKPVFVTDYPADIKAFYMRLNDDGKTVAAMDMLVPGVGELIGGSQREERLDYLLRAMEKFNLKEEDYWWYLELRKYGGTKHAGFGLGFERLIMYITGVSNIRDVESYPRTTGSAEF